MGACRWRKRVTRWFDGASQDADSERHAAQCSACAAHLRELLVLRTGVEAVAIRPEIPDAQFSAFMDGIRGRLERPARGHRGLWAAVSVAVAALIAATAAFGILSGGPRAVKAQTDVESYSTDLNNATVEYYRSEDGTATLRVLPNDGDMW